MFGVFRKLLLLLWKNLILRKRHYIVTGLQIILPVIVAIICDKLIFSEKDPLHKGGSDKGSSTLGRSLLGRGDIDYGNATQHMDKDNVMSPVQQLARWSKDLLYTPNSPEVEDFVKHYLEPEQFLLIGADMQLLYSYDPSTGKKPSGSGNQGAWKGFPDETTMERYVAQRSIDEKFYRKGTSRALNFTSRIPAGVLTYTIRSDTNTTLDEETLQALAGDENNEDDPSSIKDPRSGELGRYYFTLGFLGLQTIIDKALTKKVTGETEIDYSIRLKPLLCLVTGCDDLPSGRQIGEIDADKIAKFLPNGTLIIFFNNNYKAVIISNVLTLAFVFLVPAILGGIVSEKETGIKEFMKMSGIPSWLQWVGWMGNSLIVLMISISLITLIFTVGIMNKCDPTLLWFLLFLHIVWATTFCFLLSSLFEKPTIAITVGVLSWIVGYFVSAVISLVHAPCSITTDWMVCLFCPNGAFFYVWLFLVHLEYNGEAKWANTGEMVARTSLGEVMGMMIVSSILNFIMAVCLECVIPTKYGVSNVMSWSSLLQFGKRKKIAPRRSTVVDEDSKKFEAEPTRLSVGVEVIDLCKTFGGKKAVNKVAFKAYSGQIFCLLGHNGAGKTTTMSILTGMISPTSGTANICGKSIRTQMGTIRQSLGLCPQHDLYFADLTVEEHLKFFGRIKGWSCAEAKAQTPQLLKKLKLADKAKVSAKKLSGGQKRRLCLGVAIAGNSKVVFLDECSSGLDPEARRVIWDLLLEIRRERTIILTTHFMEEADILGDRIAIMANGRVQCCGSPTFLKKYYGAGYTLSLGLTSGEYLPGVLDLIQANVPSAFLKSQELKGNEFEVQVSIPTMEDNPTPRFPTLFAQLLDGKETLGVMDVGLTSTSIDEVFLKVDEVQHAGDDVKNNFTEIPKGAKAKGIGLVCQQFLGLVIRKMLYTRMRWMMEILLIVISIGLCIGGVTMYRTGTATTPPETSSPVDIASQLKGRVYYALAGVKKEEIEEGKIGDAYGRFVPNSKEFNTVKELDRTLENEKNQDANYKENHVVGALIGGSRATATHGSWEQHSSPLSVNLITNSILRSKPSGMNSRIAVTYHGFPQPPLPHFYSTNKALVSKEAFTRHFKIYPPLFAALLSIGLALLVTSRIILPTDERVASVKQLIRMSGVGPLGYWGSFFLWDMLLSLILTIPWMVIIHTVETYHVISNHGGAWAFLLLVVIYFVGGTLFSYVFSLVAPSTAAGFGLVVLVHSVMGILLATIVTYLMDTGKKEIVMIAESFSWVGRPTSITFSLFMVLARLTKVSSSNSYCETMKSEIDKMRLCEVGVPPSRLNYELQSCCETCSTLPGVKCYEYIDYYEWSYETKYNDLKDGSFIRPGIGQELCFMVVLCIVYLIILLIVEYAPFANLVRGATPKDTFDRKVFDSDVLDEVERVKGRLISPPDAVRVDALVVDSLCKSYGNFVAVNNITFGVESGECFGLLGVNGAGKTTTFKMLTGEVQGSEGTARIFNIDLTKNKRQFVAKIGYCPQFDALIGVLTGTQMLSLFGRLRGVKSKYLGATVEGWLYRFGLTESAHVQCQKYSGGMKRRLCAAMALIGDPPIVLLDEPTSGVDPVSRRQFWDTITIIKQAGSSSIVLTTHSMEECESLCSRLGIMVNGELQCLGRVQHLKDKFAQGYTLTVRLRAADGRRRSSAKGLPSSPQEEKRPRPVIIPKRRSTSQDKVNGFIKKIQSQFSPCTLKTRHQNDLEFQLQNPSVRLVELFKKMEEIKSASGVVIEDYSIHQGYILSIRLRPPDESHPSSASKEVQPQEESGTVMTQREDPSEATTISISENSSKKPSEMGSRGGGSIMSDVHHEPSIDKGRQSVQHPGDPKNSVVVTDTVSPKNSVVVVGTEPGNPEVEEAMRKRGRGSLTEDEVNGLIDRILTQFDPCSLKDHHQNNLQFRLEDASVRLDEVFRTIEEIKSETGDTIEDYSVQQTTLEELFLGFARDQYPVREIKMSRLMKCLTWCC